MASTEDIVGAPPSGGPRGAVAEPPVVVTRRLPSFEPTAPPPRRRRDRPRRATFRDVLLPVLLAAAVAVVLVTLGPPGTDRAAHLRHTQEFERYGWEVWNNYWYAGRYELVNYSVLYYPLAAWFGELVVVLGSIVSSVALFATLARRLVPTGARLASTAFALVLPTLLIAAQYPFALGVACALAALVLLGARRHVAAVCAACACLLASPLAFLLLGILLAGLAAGRPEVRRDRRARAVGAAVVVLALGEVLVLRLFPSGGQFPYPWLDLLGILIFAVAGAAWARAGGSRGLAGAFAAYGLAGLALYLSPSSVGGNVARLLDYFGLPLLLLVLVPRGFRPRVPAVAAVLVMVLWQAIPVVRELRGGLVQRADKAEFWTGAVDFLERHHDDDYRVHVVGTSGHWESFHVASQNIPITRGWFRQDDFPINEALYDGDELDARGLERLLRSLGVRYVVLPNDRLDYSSQREAEILRSAARGTLRPVYRGPNAEIFELPKPTPIVSAVDRATPLVPGQRTEVVAMGRTAIVLYAAAPGLYDVRVRWTPYWQVPDGAACAASAGPSGMTRLRVHRAGLVRLRFDVTLDRSTAQALGRSDASCAFPPLSRDRD